MLYGRVLPEDSIGGSAPLFVYGADSSGFLALFRPTSISYEDARTISTANGPLRHPWFEQMAGEAAISGRVRGFVLAGRGRGFFETYR